MAIKWTENKIVESFEKFNREYGHFPSVTEMDKTPYLPSSRQIQNIYGGVINFRKKHGYDIKSYASGIERSKSSFLSGKTGRSGEREVEKLLVNHFGEEFVHIEKVWGQTKQRLDFFVYNPVQSFGVEVITAVDKFSFVTNLNIKIRRYSEPISSPLFIVAINRDLDQDTIDNIIFNKVRKTPKNSRVMSLDTFASEIMNYPRYFARLN